MILSFVFLLLFLLSSCGKETIRDLRRNPDDIISSKVIEKPDRLNGTDREHDLVYSLLDLNIYFDNAFLNESTPQIRVEGLIEGATLSLKSGSCQNESLSSLTKDGVFEGIEEVDSYQDIQFFIELNYQGKLECQSIEQRWIHLIHPTISLNETSTNEDKRKPQFNISNLFVDKNVGVSLYENASCSGEPVSQIVYSSSGSSEVGVSAPLEDLNTHTYYAKQSYGGVSTCSETGVEYAYSVQIENLALSYDELIFGGSEDVITVTKVLPGSRVSLHKGSCEAPVDASITEDGTLTPSIPNSYTDTTLYVKYTYEEESVCSQISSRYIYLEKPVLNLNAAQTDLHKRTPSFDVSNLFSTKEVTVALYENSNCSGVAVSESVETDTGSATLTISSNIMDNNTHSYYAKQSYEGHSSCSLGVEYTYGLSISDLIITSSPILYGSTPSSISVSGLIPGSTVSLHKGSCNAIADDSITSDGSLTPTPVNTYIETDLYLKYSLNQTSSCQSIGVSYINLESPTLSLNSSQTSLDKRSPKFNASNLFTGKTVSVTLHESSDCSGAAVSATVESDTGSALLALTSSLTDINSHTYSVKQSYSGYTSCSNTLVYQYEIDTANLTITADDLLYGTTPGSVSVSKMISGSTVSLHKGSCESVADASINSDGSLTPTSTGSYNYSQLYIKYTKGGSSDCDPIGSYYLYLEKATLSLNSTQTDQHPLTPTFNVANLFSGKSVTAQLFEDSSCSESPVSATSSSSGGSTTLTLSSVLSDTNTHTYYVKQTYQGQSSCSLGLNYSISVDTSNLTITTSITNGVLNANVEDGYVGSTVSLHKGACNEASSDSASFTAVDQSLDLSVTSNSYSYQDVYLKYSFIGQTDCLLLDKQLTYLGTPTLTIVTPLSDIRVPEFNITGLYSGQTVTVEVYESSDCTGSSVTSSSTTNTGSKSLTKTSALTDPNSHTYSAKQSFNGVSSCSNSVSYQYPLNVDSLTVTADTILYGSTPGSVSVSGILTGSTVSLHKGSCEAPVDDSISSDGSLTPTSTGSYSEQTLYLKYSYNTSNNCKALSSSYLYLEAPLVTVDDEETARDRTTPTFSVTNLFSDKSVTVTLHEASDCSDSSVSSSAVSSTGSSSLTLSSSLESAGTYEYYVKQSYLGYSTCSAAVEYLYAPRVLSYVSSIPEYSRAINRARESYYYIFIDDYNRGIVVQGTVFNNTIKVYEGNSCKNENNLLATTKTSYDITLIYIPSLTEGVHQFSFKELDSSDNVLSCSTTSSITYKTPSIYRNTLSFAQIQGNTLKFYDIFDYSKTFSSNKAPKEVFSNGSTFTVLHADGSITAYGSNTINSVSSSLDGSIPVIRVYSSKSAFAALRSNGSVITWGSNSNGGDSSSVASKLTSGVVHIVSNSSFSGGAFAALKEDGSVVAWGNSSYGGSTTSPINVASKLTSGVVNIFSNGNAFAALKSDGSVVSWGSSTYGGNSSSVASSLTSGVIHIVSNPGAFAALKSNGSVVSWGSGSYGGSTTSPVDASSNLTSGVVNIFSTGSAFAALKSDGSVVTWGASGGNSSSVASSLTSGVLKIFSTGSAFAALKSDGSVVTWGANGGDSSSVASSLTSGVVNIFSTVSAFAALKSDGSVVTWGMSSSGGDSSSVASSLTSGVVNIFPNDSAFVALKEDGSVLSWGDSSRAGDSSPVASLINGTNKVIDIVGNNTSFLALREDRSVVIWGHLVNHKSYVLPSFSGSDKFYTNHYAIAILRSDGSVDTYGPASFGGDSSSVASKLTSGVTDIFSNYGILEGGAFAALKSDGSVVTWGNSYNGGDSSSVASSLTSGVVNIFPNASAFAALKSDGSVVTWGYSSSGGDSSSVASSLTSGVVDIFPKSYAFAALKSDGSVVAWGSSSYGGSTTSPVNAASKLTSGVVNIFSNTYAFAALKSDGSVVTWGDSSKGGDSSSVASSLTSGVVNIFSNTYAFAALKSDGSVVAWGDSSKGGDSSSVASSLTSGVVNIFSNTYAFAALKSDGSVVTWGDSSYGGNSSSVASSLTSGVVNIFAAQNAFAALKSDGSVVTWGSSSWGGNSSSVASKLTSGVVKIFSTKTAFAALKSDGSVVTWGNSSEGGDSSSIASKLTSGVVDILTNIFWGFVALKNDGSVVTWNDPLYVSLIDPSELDGTNPVSKLYLLDGPWVSESPGGNSYWHRGYLLVVIHTNGQMSVIM